MTYRHWLRPLTSLLLLLHCSAGCAGHAARMKAHGSGAKQPTYAIINMHEHIQSPAEAEKLLETMDNTGIVRTVLLGSPKETLVGKGGFVEYDENNAQILTIQTTYPNSFTAFTTMNPRDPDKLRKLQGYIRAGAKGVKLYSGHSKFYDLPLTDPEMDPVYAYLEQQQLPIMFHINLGQFLGEFEALMAQHPKMVVILPHLGLSSIRLTRLESLLDRYPRLYTDLSFGYDPFLVAALRRISATPEKYREFIQRHQDRVLFGSDMVVTKHERKTAEWLTGVIQCYRRMLETERYRCSLVGDEELNGLALSPNVLHQIYEVNPQKVLGSSGKKKQSKRR